MNTVTIYVNLLDEGTSTIRPTQAMNIGNNLYRLLPTPDYDPNDEIWEFVPGSVVKTIDTNTDDGEKILLAIKQN